MVYLDTLKLGPKMRKMNGEQEFAVVHGQPENVLAIPFWNGRAYIYGAGPGGAGSEYKKGIGK